MKKVITAYDIGRGRLLGVFESSTVAKKHVKAHQKSMNYVDDEFEVEYTSVSFNKIV